MTLSTQPLALLLSSSLLVIACSGDDGASATATESTATTTASTATATASTATATEGTATASPTSGGPDGTSSESQGSITTQGGESESTTDATTGLTTDGPTTDGTATTGQVSATATTAADTGVDTGADTGTETDTGPNMDTTTGEPPPCEPGGGDELFDLVWIANTNQGSVSKINAATFTEVGRYYTDPIQSGVSSPSRTSVSLDGRYVVVSNRDTGSVTKIAANAENCVDKNGDGVIQTSKDKAELLPFAQEECILWTTKVTANDHQWGPRATAFGIPKWNTETCKYEGEKIWVGYMVSATNARMARLNSYTGEIEASVDIPNFPLYLSYSPYGAAIDPEGNIWTTGVYSKAVFRIDANTLEITRWDSPFTDSHYGIAIDRDGRVWFSNWQGHGGISSFDPINEQWSVIPGTSGNLYRGIAADGNGGVWAASNAGFGFGCGVLEIDTKALAVKEHHKFAQCGTPLGVGFDGAGKLWYVDHSGWTWRMDPLTKEKQQLVVPNLHYTYSDFTGSGLAGVVPQ